ncbi:unnamed protein product [Trichogramma brassicae]|uniref:Uncharacterized protein n=1 Tax=Trichogramma brassicae TaxID=86971 RepID=A0A6H5J4U9_9HYME|nr:unnamed protein product [Trichogramma brassicae]
MQQVPKRRFWARVCGKGHECRPCRHEGISQYVDHFYNDLTEDFNFDEDDQLVMLDSELEEKWTKVTTQLDAAFYKYTQAQNKSEGIKMTNLLTKIFKIEKDRMTLALRFKKLMNDVKDHRIPSDLLSPEQYTRIRTHLGGKYGIEGLPTMNTQTIINRIATLRYNIDKNVVIIEMQIPLEKGAAANIWEMTTYPVEQKWAKGSSASCVCPIMEKSKDERMWHNALTTAKLSWSCKSRKENQTEPGRIWFARVVSSRRARPCISEESFYSLAQHFAVALFECHEADDFGPAKNLMNMCFTFYHEKKLGHNHSIILFKDPLKQTPNKAVVIRSYSCGYNNYAI